MRTFLAILTACAVFAAPLAALLPFGEIFPPGEDEASDPVFVAVLPTSVLGLLGLCWIPIAGGVLAMPGTGLRSHVFDRIRGDPSPAPGGWARATLIGFAAGLAAVCASAAIRAWSPEAPMEEIRWRDFGIKDALDFAAMLLAAGMIGWVGLLNLSAVICLKALGTGRRMYALAAAIVLTELLCFGGVAASAALLEEPTGLATYAEALSLSLLTVAGAWLYATRTLEHGLLALMGAPVVILAFRPLWAHLGI